MEYDTKREFLDLVKQANGGNVAAFAREYNIPLRTAQNWSGGSSAPPPWAFGLLKRLVNIDHPIN